MPFLYILIKQDLNYFNTFPNKNKPTQTTCFITINSPSPLLVILILIYIKNPLNLYTSPLKRLTDGILIN